MQVHTGDTLETEAKEMRRLGQHPLLLTFHGVARSEDSELHLVTELAPHGTLYDALHVLADRPGTTAVSDIVLLTLAQQVRPRTSLSDSLNQESELLGTEPSACLCPRACVRFLASWCANGAEPLTWRRWRRQVCEAMQFIANKGVVHRDLAARNILLFAPLTAADPLSVDTKVSDFGLARAAYSLQTTGAGAGPGLPVRYMSPEALRRNRFTEKSDVWAFGVLLWEVATLGEKPYFDTSRDDDVIRGVCGGKLRLPRPEGCSQKIFELMASCWRDSPEHRPSFRELRRHIQSMMLELGAEGPVRHLRRVIC